MPAYEHHRCASRRAATIRMVMHGSQPHVRQAWLSPNRWPDLKVGLGVPLGITATRRVDGAATARASRRGLGGRAAFRASGYHLRFVGVDRIPSGQAAYGLPTFGVVNGVHAQILRQVVNRCQAAQAPRRGSSRLAVGSA